MDANEWALEGKCLGSNLDFFNLRDPNKSAIKAVCDGCSVKGECLEYGLYPLQDYGMFGGTTPTERIELIESQQRQA